MENNLINSYGYRANGPAGIGSIDWTALLQNLVNAGVSVYTAQAQVNAAKQAAAAAAAAGTSYNLPGSLQPYAYGTPTQMPQSGISQYMPFIIGGVALFALLLFMKRR